MKFMVAWKIPTGCYKAAVERFLSTGAPNPAGVETVGRWHAPGSACGWHVVEGDATTVAELEAVWGDLLDVQVTAVIEDAEAASSLAKVHGKQNIGYALWSGGIRLSPGTAGHRPRHHQARVIGGLTGNR